LSAILSAKSVSSTEEQGVNRGLQIAACVLLFVAPPCLLLGIVDMTAGLHAHSHDQPSDGLPVAIAISVIGWAMLCLGGLLWPAACGKRWRLQLPPLLAWLVFPPVYLILFGALWYRSNPIPAWTIPDRSQLLSVDGVLGPRTSGKHGVSARITQADGRFLVFTCVPGETSADCLNAPTFSYASYDDWIGASVTLKYFRTGNFNGPQAVVAEISDSWGRYPLPYEKRQKELSRELDRYQRHLGEPNSEHIMIIAVAMPLLLLFFFRPVSRRGRNGADAAPEAANGL